MHATARLNQLVLLAGSALEADVIQRWAGQQVLMVLDESRGKDALQLVLNFSPEPPAYRSPAADFTLDVEDVASELRQPKKLRW